MELPHLSQSACCEYELAGRLTPTPDQYDAIQISDYIKDFTNDDLTSNDDDESKSRKSAEIVESVIADVADIKVAAWSVQTTSITSPILDLSRPRLTRASKTSRDSCECVVYVQSPEGATDVLYVSSSLAN